MFVTVVFMISGLLGFLASPGCTPLISHHLVPLESSKAHGESTGNDAVDVNASHAPPPIKVAVCLSGDIKNFRPFVQNQIKFFFDQPGIKVYLFVFTSTLIHYRHLNDQSILWKHESKDERVVIDWLQVAYGERLISVHVDVDDKEFLYDALKHGISPATVDSRRWNFASQFYKIVRCLRMAHSHSAYPFDVIVRMRLDDFFPVPMNILPVMNNIPGSVFYSPPNGGSGGYVSDAFLASNSISHFLTGYERGLNEYFDTNVGVRDPEHVLSTVFPVSFHFSSEVWRIGAPVTLPILLSDLPWIDMCFLKDIRSDEYTVNLENNLQANISVSDRSCSKAAERRRGAIRAA